MGVGSSLSDGVPTTNSGVLWSEWEPEPGDAEKCFRCGRLDKLWINRHRFTVRIARDIDPGRIASGIQELVSFNALGAVFEAKRHRKEFSSVDRFGPKDIGRLPRRYRSVALAYWAMALR